MNIYGVHLVLQIPPPFRSSWLQYLRAVSDYVLVVLVVYGNAVLNATASTNGAAHPPGVINKSRPNDAQIPTPEASSMVFVPVVLLPSHKA
jgi:hypothetical protein